MGLNQSVQMYQMENNNQDRISIGDVIDNNAYKNEKAYNLTRALLDIAILARAVRLVGQKKSKNVLM